MKKKISSSISVTTVDDGENAFRLDLDNENDSMLYTESGTLVSGSVTSQARLYDGSDVVTSGVSFSKHSQSGCTATVSATGLVTVTGMSAVSGKVIIKATYGGSDYYATLTLKKIVNGDKYDLLIEPNAIAYNSTTDTPDKTTLSISVYKTSVSSGGGVTRVLSAPPSGYAVYANGTPLTTSATGKYSCTTDNSEISEVQVKIATGATATDILDAETVPVNKAANGEKGESVAIAFVTPDKINVLCNYLGKCEAVSQVVTFSLKVGNETKTNITVTNPSGISKPSISGTGNTRTISISANEAISNVTKSLVFTVSWTDANDKTYSAPATVSIAESDQGHIGRFYYYAGVYDNDTEYKFEPTQAPFVMRHMTLDNVESDYFFMLDYAADPKKQQGNTTQTSKGQDPFNSSYRNGNPWTKMASEQQYYIAKAFFGEYAQFGGFIINGDWMISKNGKIGNNESTEYIYFDPDAPLGYRDFGISEYTTLPTSFEYIGNALNLTKGKKILVVTGKVGENGGNIEVQLFRTTPSVAIGNKVIIKNTNRQTSSVQIEIGADTKYRIKAMAGSGAKIYLVQLLSFVPNFAVNGNTGATYQSRGLFMGNIQSPLLVINDGNKGGYGTVYGNVFELKRLDSIGGIHLENFTETILELPFPTAADNGLTFYVLNYTSHAITIRGGSMTARSILVNGLMELMVIKEKEVDDMYKWVIVDARNIESGLPSGTLDSEEPYEYGRIKPKI